MLVEPKTSATSYHLKPSGVLLPGLFLLLLGFGNLAVGFYKEQQYQQVIDGLANSQTIAGLHNASLITRIRLIEERITRQYERRKKALARVDFYRLVGFGGKVFIALSIPFLVFSGLLAMQVKSKKLRQ